MAEPSLWDLDEAESRDFAKKLKDFAGTKVTISAATPDGKNLAVKIDRALRQAMWTPDLAAENLAAKEPVTGVAVWLNSSDDRTTDAGQALVLALTDAGIKVPTALTRLKYKDASMRSPLYIIVGQRP